MSHSHQSCQRAIDLLFVGQLPQDGLPQLYQELESCPRCAEHYRRHHRAESTLCEAGIEPSVLALARLEQAVIASTDAAWWRWLRNQRWLLAPAAAAPAALVLLLLLSQPGNDRLAADDPRMVAATGNAVELRPRGEQRPRSSEIGIRAFALDPGDRIAEPDAQVSMQSTLTFAYTNVAIGIGFLTLFGIQEGGQVRWYYPSYDGNLSVYIEDNRVDEPLGDGIQLEVNHSPGWLRIVALFTVSPLETEAVEAMVRELDREGVAFDSDSPISWPGLPYIGQHHLLVELNP